MVTALGAMGACAPPASAQGPKSPGPKPPKLAAQVKADGAAVRLLEANSGFPYTQVTLRLPRVSGPGVQAREAGFVTGLDVVLSTQRPHERGQPAPVELSVAYRGQQLAQARYVGKDVYVLLDVARWGSLPLALGASTRAKLNELNLAFGERWFEVPSATLAKLTAKTTRRFKPVSPAGLRGLATGAVAKLAGGLDPSEEPLPGGNERFAERGTLGSLASAAAQTAQALHLAPAPSAPTASTASVPQGTYYLAMTTAAGGRYMAKVEVAIATAKRQSVTAELAFTHVARPVAVPANATVVTSSMQSSIGL